MAKLNEQQQAFLRNPYFAVVTTLRQDGSPHNTVVWVDVDEEAVIFNTAEGRAKPKHLRGDGRAALTVIDPQDGHRWISVSGPVELSHEGADAQIDRLSAKYTGREKFCSHAPGVRRVNVRISPERVDSSGLER